MTRGQKLVLAGTIAAGAAARFATLDLQSFHHDEAVHVSLMKLSFPDLVGEIVDGERSPPVYYIVDWVWTRVFGTGEVGMRSLSALIGTTMIPAAFFLGRELRNERTGIFIAVLVALNPLLVWYSQEARSYILMALFITLALGFAARAQRRDSTSKAVWLWAAFSLAAIATHYFAAFLVAGMAAWLLTTVDRDRVLGAMALIAAGCAALVPLALAQRGEDRRDGFADLSLPARIGEVPLDYVSSEQPDPLAGSSRVDRVQIGAAVGGGAIALLALILFWRHRPDDQASGFAMAGIALFGLLVPAIAALVGADFLKPRNLMAGVVPALAFVGLAFANERARRLGALGLATASALFAGVVVAVNASEEMQRNDWRRVAETIGENDGEPRLLAIPRNGDDSLELYLGLKRYIGGPDGGSGERSGLPVRSIVAVSTTTSISPPTGFTIMNEIPVPPLFTVWELESETERSVSQSMLAAVLQERVATYRDGPLK